VCLGKSTVLFPYDKIFSSNSTKCLKKYILRKCTEKSIVDGCSFGTFGTSIFPSSLFSANEISVKRKISGIFLLRQKRWLKCAISWLQSLPPCLKINKEIHREKIFANIALGRLKFTLLQNYNACSPTCNTT
jgi:hypothetical protein